VGFTRPLAWENPSVETKGGVMALITLSASYGSGGSRIGPELADALGVPFLDRAIPTAVADHLAMSQDEVLAHDESPGGLLARIRSSLALSPEHDEDTFRLETERVLREHTAAGNAVVLGRAAAVVLRDDGRALHVRLDGPAERRIAQAALLEDVDFDEAGRRLKQNDKAREGYVRHYYGVDARDPRLYHLVVDSTAIPLGACVQLIALAARARERTAAAT
jgi:cytidylate kinase